ncbi:hypothetical protein [Solitalea koreensis]|uniref:Uncharacterized protein n=1 Tax=Solitalea koreensis TaxID=543615 RepID=A0A521CEI2_9SPHI|nr:hypothetical protein [Solitalea koreensis]SMO57846.1 hypothetical protein SAMN06265350_1046 [Solitalea koreensis]
MFDIGEPLFNALATPIRNSDSGLEFAERLKIAHDTAVGVVASEFTQTDRIFINQIGNFFTIPSICFSATASSFLCKLPQRLQLYSSIFKGLVLNTNT